MSMTDKDLNENGKRPMAPSSISDFIPPPFIKGPQNTNNNHEQQHTIIDKSDSEIEQVVPSVEQEILPLLKPQPQPLAGPKTVRILTTDISAENPTNTLVSSESREQLIQVVIQGLKQGRIEFIAEAHQILQERNARNVVKEVLMECQERHLEAVKQLCHQQHQINNQHHKEVEKEKAIQNEQARLQNVVQELSLQVLTLKKKHETEIQELKQELEAVKKNNRKNLKNALNKSIRDLYS